MNTAVQTYSKTEWNLVSDIMDRVSEAMAGKEPTSAVDWHKLQSLVLRTYEQQGISMDPDVVSRVCQAMAQPALPSQSRDTTLSRKDGPLAKATAALERVKQHKPMTTAGMIERMQATVRRHETVRRNVILSTLSVATAIPIVSLCLLSIFWSTLSSGQALFSICGAFATWFVTLIGMAIFDPSMGNDEMKSLEKSTAKAIESIEKGCLFDNKVNSTLEETLGFSYNHQILSDHASSWEMGNRMALEDPALRQAWAAWLQGDAPIREGDVALLINAAHAIRHAQSTLAVYEPDHGLKGQATGRARALRSLQNAPTTGSLPARR